MGYQKELEIAVEAVCEAAKICRSVQAGIDPGVLEKKDRSPVTVADFSSQAVIAKALLEAFPNDPMIGEEDAEELRTDANNTFLTTIQNELKNIGIDADGSQVCDWIDHGGASEFSNRFWTLDPIDGTKGFLRKEQYAISLALIVDGVIQVAVLGCPNLPRNLKHDTNNEENGLLFTAIRGEGADVRTFENPTGTKSIFVSQTMESAEAKFCESVESGHSSHDQSAEVATLLEMVREPVRLDSQAKYAVVARGEADIYLRLPTRVGYQEKIWDHAGGVLVVEEAGGKVTDITGKPLEFTHGRELAQNRGVVVTNTHLHQVVINALKSAGVK